MVLWIITWSLESPCRTCRQTGSSRDFCSQGKSITRKWGVVANQTVGNYEDIS